MNSKFLGCVVHQSGPTPKDEVQRLLGTLNYFGKCMPHLSYQMGAIRGLVRNNIMFEWIGAHYHQGMNFEKMLIQATFLAVNYS